MEMHSQRGWMRTAFVVAGTLLVASPAMAQSAAELRELIENHLRYTRSTVARRVLDNWEAVLGKFVKVIPVDYKRALKRMNREAAFESEAEAVEV